MATAGLVQSHCCIAGVRQGSLHIRKSKMYVQVLCLYRNQVHLSTRASDVGVYLAVQCIAEICVTIAEQ